MKLLKDLLEFYDVESSEELNKLLEEDDPRVKDLKEFLAYYQKRLEEKYSRKEEEK